MARAMDRIMAVHVFQPCPRGVSVWVVSVKDEAEAKVKVEVVSTFTVSSCVFWVACCVLRVLAVALVSVTCSLC